MSDLIKNRLMSTFVILLAASIPFGFFMAIYTNGARWSWFCTPILIFLIFLS